VEGKSQGQKENKRVVEFAATIEVEILFYALSP